MKIVLIGYMGTGKTSVGKILAAKLGWPLFDTDEMIAHDVGMAIPDIFAKKGEPFFRDAESAAIQMVSCLDKCVVSTGGGAVLRDENKKALRANSLVVHLAAGADTILYRIGEDAMRPLLPKGVSAKDNLNKMLSARSPHYEACRHMILETDNATEEKLAETILAKLNEASE